MISAIGMSLILQNYAQISQGPRQQGIPTLLSGVFRLEFDGGVVQITYTKVFILVASLLGMAILTYHSAHPAGAHLPRHPAGSQNGFDSRHQYRSGDLAGVRDRCRHGRAGRGADHHELRHLRFYVGFIIGIKAFTAAVLGGIGSLPGAMLGGLLLGAAEAQFAGMVNSDYKDVFSFGLLVAILIFRPQGLLGRPLIAKV